MDWADLTAVMTMVVAACAASGWLVLRKLGRVERERQLKFERQLSTLDDAVRALETRLSELHSSASPSHAVETAEPAEDGVGEDSSGEAVVPEIRAAVAAAVVAVAGPGARLRSLRAVEPNAGVSAWTQQGRSIVQSSHNIRPERQSSRTAPERES
jgi:hypothetical protein